MAEINVGGIRIGVSLATEDLAKGIAQIQKNLRKVGRDFQSVGKDLSVGLTAPIVAFGGLAAKAAIDFESAFAGVRKTVNTSKEGFKELENGILSMSKRLPASANNIAKVAENAGQLGIEKKNILAFSETMTRLADSTNISADEGSKLIAQFANFTNLPQTQFSNLGSAIVELGNNTATTEDKIVDMAHGIGAASAQAGISHGQIIGLSAAISATGIEAEKGGSAFSKALREMNTAVLSNSDDLKAYSKIAGVDFKKAFQTDAAGAVVSFVKGLQSIAKSGGDMAAALSSVGISEIRAVDTFSRLALSADKVSDALDLGKKAFEENTALTKESEERYKTLASQLDVTRNKLVALGISFGKELTPFIAELNKSIGSTFEYFEQMDGSIKRSIITFAATSAIVGPLITAIGVLAAVVGSAALVFGTTLVIALAGSVTAFQHLRAEINAFDYSAWASDLNARFIELKYSILNVDFSEFTRHLGGIKEQLLFSIPVLREYLLLVSATAKAMKFDFAGAASDLKEIFTNSTQAIIDQKKALTENQEVVKGTTNTQLDLAGSFEMFGWSAENATTTTKVLKDETIKADKTFNDFGETTKKGTKEIDKAAEALNNLKKQLQQSAADKNLDFLKENLQGAIDSDASMATIQSLQDEIYKAVRQGAEQGFIDSEGVITAESKKYIDQKARYEADEITSSITKGTKKGVDKAEGIYKRLPDFLAKGITDALINGISDGFNSETLKDIGKSVGAVFADSFQDKFKNLFKKGEFDKLLSGSFEDFITGSGLADLGIAYGTTSLANNLSDNKKDTTGGVISGAVLGASLGAAYGSVVPGLGTAIGAVVGAGAGYLAGSTGKSSEKGQVSRKNTVNYIEDKIGGSYLPFLTEQGNIILGKTGRFSVDQGGGFLEDATRLVADAYLAYVTMGASLATSQTREGAGNLATGGERYDPVPGQIQGGDWANQYQDQFQSVFNSFNALGSAMSQFSGETQTEASKIGVVLAENLNGNLDNARLLLQSMGVGAKDLEEAFLQIGLSGEQSWHTVEIYMQSISDLTGEGLIGVGDLQGAFGQLTDSAGRGQAALFALQNLAIEGQEKGITNLQDLKAEMLNSGEFSESDVTILFQAIEQRGITTLEGLQGASQRLLGGVVADLESLGFGWTKFNEIADQASLSLAELEKQMNEINNRSIDIEVNINYQENNKPDPLDGAEVLINKDGNAFHAGTVKKFADGGIFGSPTLFGYGKNLGMLGEAGPEAVMPLTRKNGKLGVMAQGMNQGMTINIDARGAERGVDRSIMSAMSQMEDRILNRAMRAMSKGY